MELTITILPLLAKNLILSVEKHACPITVVIMRLAHYYWSTELLMLGSFLPLILAHSPICSAPSKISAYFLGFKWFAVVVPEVSFTIKSLHRDDITFLILFITIIKNIFSEFQRLVVISKPVTSLKLRCVLTHRFSVK